MKIVVILRLEPVLTEELELTEDERDIDREWIGLELNQFDDQALEQAVLLKESMGASVSAIAVENEGVERMLKTALARGVDDVMMIPLDDNSVESRSSRALASIYIEALRALNPDLVLVGVLSTADLYGELAPYLGAQLGWPQASAISKVDLCDGKVTVRQEYSGGRAALIAMPLPAVIGLQTAEQPPRYVAGSKLRELLKFQIPTLDVSAKPTSDQSDSTRLVLPDLEGGAIMLEGDVDDIATQLISLLQTRGFA